MPVDKSKKQYRKLLRQKVETLSSLQRLHYGSGRFALLLIFRGMNSAGRDGAIRRVMSGVSPQGCEVFCFKQPSETEMEDGLLWRTACRLTGSGHPGVSDRSSGAEVMVVRVCPEFLSSFNSSRELKDAESPREDDRYQSISDLERHLLEHSIRTIKMFLHLSKDEQRKRLLDRVDQLDKNWNYSVADIHERRFWNQYKVAFEDPPSIASKSNSPWYVVPADDKITGRLIGSLTGNDPVMDSRRSYPDSKAERRA